MQCHFRWLTRQVSVSQWLVSASRDIIGLNLFNYRAEFV